MNKKSKKGFTIIELLAAVVIVGIIISLAVIAINRYVLQGHNTVDSQLEKQLILATKSYYTDNKTKFITNENTGVVVWYTTLRAENYMTNDLVDSNGNSCSKSYVVVKKDSSKYSYSGCVICDNDGYNNTNGKKECSESLKNNIYCEWTDVNGNKLDKTYLGVKKNNQVTLKLTCKGKGIKFSKGQSSLDVNNMISTKFGNISRIDYDAPTNNKNEVISFVSNIKYTTLPNADGNDVISFNENSAYVVDNVGQKIPNEAAVYDGIIIDGKGPSCSLTGPYKDSGLKTSVKAVKSGTTVYYGLVCKDDNNVNGTIEKSGFASSDSISELNIISRPKNEAKEKSAIISVKVTKGSSSKLKLTYKKDQLHDNYDNGNDETTSSVDGKASELVIDDQAPTCVFSDPSSDIDIMYSKTKLNIKDPTDSVYYSLKCTDENNIENNFNINQVVNYGFGKVKLEKTNKVKINGDDYGYEYILKAYSTNVEGTAKLTYNTNYAVDLAGNHGSGVVESRSVTMYDPDKIPSCNIDVTYANDLRSATLTGYMSDEKGLSGYSWSTNYSEPGSYSYISGTSRDVTNTVDENGHYYLHMKNINDLLGYCYIYVAKIKPAPPEAPELKASDGIASGKWHTSSYKLEASGSGSNVKYYYGTSSNNVTSTTKPEITSETTGKTYYAKACRAEDSTNCSGTVTYEAKLDTNPPSCNLYFTTDKYRSEGGRNTYFSSNEANEVYVELSCTDSISGVDTTTLYKDGKDSNYDKKLKLTSTGTYTIKAVAYDKAKNKMDGKNHTVKIACELGNWVKGESSYVTSCTPVTKDTSKVECGKTKYVNYYTYTASKKKCTNYSTPKTTYKWGTAKAKELYKNGQCVFSVPYDKKTTPCTNGKYYYDDVECVKCNRGSVGRDGTCNRNTCCIKKKYTIQKCIVKTTEKECTKYKYSDYTKDKGVKVEKDKCKKSGTAGTDEKYYTCGSDTYVLKTPYTRTCK